VRAAIGRFSGAAFDPSAASLRNQLNRRRKV
jgi:hypothetical protein